MVCTAQMYSPKVLICKENFPTSACVGIRWDAVFTFVSSIFDAAVRFVSAPGLLSGLATGLSLVSPAFASCCGAAPLASGGEVAAPAAGAGAPVADAMPGEDGAPPDDTRGSDGPIKCDVMNPATKLNKLMRMSPKIIPISEIRFMPPRKSTFLFVFGIDTSTELQYTSTNDDWSDNITEYSSGGDNYELFITTLTL